MSGLAFGRDTRLIHEWVTNGPRSHELNLLALGGELRRWADYFDRVSKEVCPTCHLATPEEGSVLFAGVEFPTRCPDVWHSREGS